MFTPTKEQNFISPTGSQDSQMIIASLQRELYESKQKCKQAEQLLQEAQQSASNTLAKTSPIAQRLLGSNSSSSNVANIGTYEEDNVAALKAEIQDLHQQLAQAKEDRWNSMYKQEYAMREKERLFKDQLSTKERQMEEQRLQFQQENDALRNAKNETLLECSQLKADLERTTRQLKDAEEEIKRLRHEDRKAKNELTDFEYQLARTSTSLGFSRQEEEERKRDILGGESLAENPFDKVKQTSEPSASQSASGDSKEKTLKKELSNADHSSTTTTHIQLALLWEATRMNEKEKEGLRKEKEAEVLSATRVLEEQRKKERMLATEEVSRVEQKWKNELANKTQRMRDEITKLEREKNEAEEEAARERTMRMEMTSSFMSLTAPIAKHLLNSTVPAFSSASLSSSDYGQHMQTYPRPSNNSMESTQRTVSSFSSFVVPGNTPERTNIQASSFETPKHSQESNEQNRFTSPEPSTAASTRSSAPSAQNLPPSPRQSAFSSSSFSSSPSSSSSVEEGESES
ncbi:uncharacterized protein MONOS_8332 [Monocercomonoides exilis]|uniref:uncharacterized protein n=1 Tax=Monocercomonoides exilis TaxID=2049356 RepID=UPI00355A5C94|nr:hypothetical protein MONOS_8332 [Monocercomonoides exilis]|eukprot:MONOS_8332.1-p1 / transcript=MONOS_8332.1 / gene=MONOS_8332 / organism=Monocercomonoides_exilis_PA203 / gene_product=unspecified product / transcript_product=unspecified product / location=Mono_scaffold00312:47378-48986(+) / protein_length=517 / sequence_SO=supercontig / SO=protein_coding / is_pseudo=false